MSEIGQLTLVLGGARSGKSRHAESLLTAFAAPWTYLATAEAHDAEMQTRIALHQARRGDGWRTQEATVGLAEAMAALPGEQPVLIDCLTLWLSNLMLAGQPIAPAAEALLTAIATRSGPTIAVSNEVGLGIVPETKLGRDFRDEAGRLNQQFAARAGKVVVMIAGLPLILKSSQT